MTSLDPRRSDFCSPSLLGNDLVLDSGLARHHERCRCLRLRFVQEFLVTFADDEREAQPEIVTGMLFGRHQLIKLSPKKTVEGFVGAFFVTVIFAVGVSLLSLISLGIDRRD